MPLLNKGLCKKDCSRCTLNGRCGGCSMCEASICRRDCKECFSLCPMRPQSIPHLNAIGGAQISLKENSDINIPSHIPILPDRFREVPEYELMPIIGVHGGNMFSNDGRKIKKSYQNGYVNALNIDGRCRAILEFYVKDRTLEGFWDNRGEIYENLKKLNFLGVISPNFSVYEDAPRMDHIYNIKRSTVVYNEMLDKGINAIPDVSWYNINDLDHWIEEVNLRGIKLLAFSFQVVDVILKASNLWKSYLLGFQYLCKNIDPGVKIIIAGMTSHRRVEEVHRAAVGQSLYVLNQSAFLQSRRGMLSEGRVSDTRTNVNVLFEKNVLYFNKVYDELQDKYQLNGGE